MNKRKEKFGPWRIIPAKERGDRIAIAAKGAEKYSSRGPIAMVGKRHKNAMENAALIAAAPKMYAELKDLLDAMESGCFPQVAPGVDYPAVMEKKWELRKLLKEARGEK